MRTIQGGARPFEWKGVNINGKAMYRNDKTGEIHALFLNRKGKPCLLYTSPSPRD